MRHLPVYLYQQRKQPRHGKICMLINLAHTYSMQVSDGLYLCSARGSHRPLGYCFETARVFDGLPRDAYSHPPLCSP